MFPYSPRLSYFKRFSMTVLALIVILLYQSFSSNTNIHIRSQHQQVLVVNDAFVLPPKQHYKHIVAYYSSFPSKISPRITFQLHSTKSRKMTNIFNLYVKCPLGNVTLGNGKSFRYTGEFRNGSLPKELIRVDSYTDIGDGISPTIRTGRVLDFTTTISTNLKLLFIGDSVMVQLSQSFDEMIMMDKSLLTRTILWEAWSGHDGGTVVAPTRGGGVAATWRMTGLLSRKKKGKPPANSGGGGWSDFEIHTFLNHSYSQERDNNTVKSERNQSLISEFDVVVYRIMHGWMKTQEITLDRMVEAIELASELLGAQTVILMTIPFTNNVKTVEEMNEIELLNNVVRDIAKQWHSRSNTRVKNVLVQEYGNYYNHILWTNARFLGYNVSHPLYSNQQKFNVEGPNFLYDRLNDGQKWSPSIAMVCSDMSSLSVERNKCNRNYLFLDGMHICPETLSNRYGASVACLLGCVYNGNEQQSFMGDEKDLRKCEMECNEQFMSVMPVDDFWVDGNVTIVSFA